MEDKNTDNMEKQIRKKNAVVTRSSIVRIKNTRI